MGSARNSAKNSVWHHVRAGCQRQAPLVLTVILAGAAFAAAAIALVRPTYTAIAHITIEAPPASTSEGQSPNDLLIAERTRLNAFAESLSASLASPAVRAALPIPICPTTTNWRLSENCGSLRLQDTNEPRALQLVATASSPEGAQTLADVAAKVALQDSQTRQASIVSRLREPHLRALTRAREQLEINLRSQADTSADLPPAVAAFRLRSLNRIGSDKDPALWAALFGPNVTPDQALEVRLRWGERAARTPVEAPTEDQTLTAVETDFERAFALALRVAPQYPKINAEPKPSARPLAQDQPPAAVILATLAGLGALLGVVFGLFRELRRRVVVRLDDVESRLGAPLLAPAPVVNAGDLRLLDPALRSPAGAVAESPQSLIAASMRAALAALAQTPPNRSGGQAIAVIADQFDVGTSTMAAGLARTAAQAGRKVIVVDADVREQGCVAALGMASARAKRPLSEWRDLVRPDPQTRLDVLPIPARPGLLPFSFPDVDFGDTINELRSTYDLVIIDCPPTSIRADGAIAARAADVVILVALWNKTQVGAARAVRQHLGRFNARTPDWVLLNQTDTQETTAWFGRDTQPDQVSDTVSGIGVVAT
jgi:Mrp family chromosome partitioning ATPase